MFIYIHYMLKHVFISLHTLINFMFVNLLNNAVKQQYCPTATISKNSKLVHFQYTNTDAFFFQVSMYFSVEYIVFIIFLFFIFSALAHSKVEDVRSVLEYYMQFDDPIAKFRENQLILQVTIISLKDNFVWVEKNPHPSYG